MVDVFGHNFISLFFLEKIGHYFIIIQFLQLNFLQFLARDEELGLGYLEARFLGSIEEFVPVSLA